MSFKKNTKSANDRYFQRGVSHQKQEVHHAIKKLDHGLFPNAFCKINNDYLTNNPRRCTVIHADGSGTKSILAYLHYKETGDAKVFRGIAQDSLVMNLDDILCVGASKRILVSSTINRNARRCPGEVLSALIDGTEEFLEHLRHQGISIFSGGGETADVGDLTGTILVDSCTVATLLKKNIIDAGKICPDLVIVGLSSSGKAKGEKKINSGIGSNGLTSARHDLLSSYYKKKYPETVDTLTPNHLSYCGKYKLQDQLPLTKSMTIGQALLSPTRSYAPVLEKIYKEHRSMVIAAIHCSGGGQTKCLKFGQGIHFIKDDLFKIPPIFTTIQASSKTTMQEMFQVFNMGHRMEIYCKPKHANEIIAISNSFGIEAKIIGRTETSQQKTGKNHLSLTYGADLRLTYGANLRLTYGAGGLRLA